MLIKVFITVIQSQQPLSWADYPFLLIIIASIFIEALLIEELPTYTRYELDFSVTLRFYCQYDRQYDRVNTIRNLTVLIFGVNLCFENSGWYSSTFIRECHLYILYGVDR